MFFICSFSGILYIVLHFYFECFKTVLDILFGREEWGYRWDILISKAHCLIIEHGGIVLIAQFSVRFTKKFQMLHKRYSPLSLKKTKTIIC